MQGREAADAGEERGDEDPDLGLADQMVVAEGELRRDYRDMEVMVFGDAPALDLIMDALRRMENEINNPPVR